MIRALRLTGVVLLLAALAACGDDDGDEDVSATTTEPPTSTTTAADDPPPAPVGDAVELRADPPSRIPAGPHTWELTVVNVSDGPVTLTFPTSQKADATLLADDGTVVHRWSEGMFFAQQIVEQTLAAGESETIELQDDLSDVEPGTYELTLDLTVVGPPAPVVTSVRIVAPEG